MTPDRTIFEDTPNAQATQAISEMLSLKNIGIPPPPSPMPWMETLARTDAKAFEKLPLTSLSKAKSSLGYATESGRPVLYSRQWFRTLPMPMFRIIVELAPKGERADNLPPRFQDQALLSPPPVPRGKKAKRVNTNGNGKVVNKR
ncbi:MAG: hypothetical protein Q9164_004071 [Protoblastenia rupestris]